MSSERPVAYVLGTFPQASQTFIAREIRGLKQHDVPLMVFALARRPADALEGADRAWYSSVHFVPFFVAPRTLAANLRLIARAPRRYFSTLWALLRLPHRPRIMTARAMLLMLQSAWIADRIETAGGCRQVHAHFALAQTEVAMAVAGLLGCPFSFTAHARDIYAAPSALPEKIRSAAVVVTCTAYNVEHMRGLCPDVPSDHIRLVHHGVDVSGLAAVAAERKASPPDEPTILAAGRLIEKKGFDTLIDACAELRRRSVPFRCRIFGTGPMQSALGRQITDAGLDAHVSLPGWAAPAALLQELGRATVFAMPSRVSRGGDRDGIPNVVLEAMAAGVPVVATDISGIPEAVDHERTGLLVPADSPSDLADALSAILTDHEMAVRFGEAARQRIGEEFTLDVATGRLAAIFGVSDPAMKV